MLILTDTCLYENGRLFRIGRRAPRTGSAGIEIRGAGLAKHTGALKFGVRGWLSTPVSEDGHYFRSGR